MENVELYLMIILVVAYSYQYRGLLQVVWKVSDQQNVATIGLN